jgi:hypothetical protein
MPAKPHRIRSYHPSGLYAKRPPVPAHQQATTDLKAELIADAGGEDELTAAKRLLIDAIVTATLKSRVVHSYLATIERPWVDRRSNKVWQCVLDAAKLEAHLAKLLGQLGLERTPAPVMDVIGEVQRLHAEDAAAATQAPPDEHEP